MYRYVKKFVYIQFFAQNIFVLCVTVIIVILLDRLGHKESKNSL